MNKIKRIVQSRLKRDRYPMPEFFKQALLRENVMELYCLRPPYQQNDYIGWITRAVREETKQCRIKQMIDELKQGNVYMKMKWNLKRK